MFKNEDFERLYIRYKAEAMPNGVSIQAYCKRNGVPFSLFDKWYKDTRHKVVRVQVEGAPEPGDTSAEPEQKASLMTQDCHDREAVRIMIDIRMTNGLRLSKRNLGYRDLKTLVEKLEGLC